MTTDIIMLNIHFKLSNDSKNSVSCLDMNLTEILLVTNWNHS